MKASFSSLHAWVRRGLSKAVLFLAALLPPSTNAQSTHVATTVASQPPYQTVPTLHGPSAQNNAVLTATRFAPPVSSGALAYVLFTRPNVCVRAADVVYVIDRTGSMGAHNSVILSADGVRRMLNLVATCGGTFTVVRVNGPARDQLRHLDLPPPPLLALPIVRVSDTLNSAFEADAARRRAKRLQEAWQRTVDERLQSIDSTMQSFAEYIALTAAETPASGPSPVCQALKEAVAFFERARVPDANYALSRVRVLLTYSDLRASDRSARCVTQLPVNTILSLTQLTSQSLTLQPKPARVFVENDIAPILERLMGEKQ